jgi:hypothetical protein
MKPFNFLRSLFAGLPLRSRGCAGGGSWDALDASEQTIAALLTRYATGLSASTSALQGTRSLVLTAAATTAQAGETGTQRVRRAPRVPRMKVFQFSTVAAAVAVIAVAVSAVLTYPGSPLHNGQVDVGSGQPSAGTSETLLADVAAAEARLGELDELAAERDWSGVEDAADAYTAVLMTISVPDDDSDRDFLRGALDEHLAILQELRVDAPAGAQVALDKAIARIEAMLADADKKDKEHGHTPPPKATKEPKDTKEPKPTKEPKDTKEPKPTKEPK